MILYALLDEVSLRKRGLDYTHFIKKALLNGAKIVQYRNKLDNLEITKEKLKEVVSLFKGEVIINDYPELARFCSGVHLGQEDLAKYSSSKMEAVLKIKEMIPGKIIGISTHNEQEVIEANSLDIDYIGLGSCRATSTKDDATVLGIKRVSEIAKLSKHPVAAIGGLRVDDRIDNVKYIVVGSALYED